MESNKKEESLMESGLANRHGKVGELRMIKVLLSMRTRTHHCVRTET